MVFPSISSSLSQILFESCFQMLTYFTSYLKETSSPGVTQLTCNLYYYISDWNIKQELVLSTTAVGILCGSTETPALSTVLTGPSFLGMGPHFLESAGAPKKRPVWGGKKIFWTPQKKFHRGNGCDMCFLQKVWKKSVKFGLCSCSKISLPHIGGSHPVPSLSILSTERWGTAMYYPPTHCLPAQSITHLRHQNTWQSLHFLFQFLATSN